MLERKSHLFLLFVTISVLFWGLMFAHAVYRQRADEVLFQQKRALVGWLGLTDLCLFTDARYTRNPSMADMNTPFQDYPLSFEHFPSGSLLSLPPHLRAHAEDR